MTDIDFRPDWEKREPDFTNEAGVKWWLDKDLTKYAKREGLDYQVFVVRTPDGYITRLILDEKKEPIFEHQSLENIAVHLDIMKIANRKY